MLNDVKLFEDDLGLWQDLLDDGEVGGIHVAGHGYDPGIFGVHVFEQCFERALSKRRTASQPRLYFAAMAVVERIPRAFLIHVAHMGGVKRG